MAEHSATNTPTRADARQRSLRTLAQGLAIDVIVAVGTASTATLATLNDNDLLAGAAWVALGASILKSGLTAVASYASRLKLPPTEL